MALKDILSLIDHKLKDVYHTVAYSPVKDRAAVAKRLDDTRSKFLATEPPRGKKDFSVANNVVEFRPVVPGAGALMLAGSDVSYVPAERFADFLVGLKAAVEAGELDAELEAAHGDQAKTSTTKTPRAPRAPREPGSGSGWSEERRARFAASIEARQKAKAGG